MAIEHPTIVHALPHRVRVRVPGLVGQREAAERLARNLAEAGAYDRVIVRDRTGSVLVEASGPTDPERVRSQIVACLSAERDEHGRPLIGSSDGRSAGPTRVAQAIAHAVSGINADVREALDHRADLGTLLPLTFAGLAMAEVSYTGKLPVPSWFSLFWWSLRSFMTFNVAAVEHHDDCPEPDDGKKGS